MLKSIISLFSSLDHKKSKTVLFFKLIIWRINKIFIKTSIIHTFFNELKIIVTPYSSYGALVFYLGLPDKQEMNYLLKQLNSSDIFIDVGANIGVYSILASYKIKKGKIYAFEPNVKILSDLKNNIQLNGIKNIEIISKIVSNHNKSELFESNDISEISSISKKSGKNIHQISSITIDSFLKNEKIKSVKLLKIDVEGAEGLIFEGAVKSLKSKIIKNIIFELNLNCTNFGHSPAKIISLLNSFNYDVYQFTNSGYLKIEKCSKIDFKKTMNLLATYK